MKLLKIAVTGLILSAIVLLSTGCAAASVSSTAAGQVAAVQRGGLAVSVTGTGNLAFSNSQDLAFAISGYVQEVLVKEGESVTKGQVLAKLDTSEWDKQVKKLETALVTAQRNLATKARALTRAQDQVTSRENEIAKAERQVTAKDNDIAKAERQVAARELAVRQAELDVKTAEYNITKIAEVKKVQDDIDNAEYALKFAQSIMSGSLGGTAQVSDLAYWGQIATAAQKQLDDANDRMQEILKGTSIAVTTDVKLQVAKTQLQVEQGQRSLSEAKIAVAEARTAVEDARFARKDAELALKNARLNKEDAEQAVKDAELAREDAGQTVKDAQDALDEANDLSPLIVAPFDGFIPKISVNGGDEIFKGKVAMQIADPTQFEAVILVSEKNISSLKVEQNATVALDALSGVTFPARITRIAPLVTTSQGVVNYQVTVKLTSTQPTSRAASASVQAPSPSSTGGTSRAMPAMPSPGTSGSFQRPGGASGSATTGTPGSSGTAQAIALKSGMSAVVTIVTQQKDNVLKVPNRAITRQGQNSTVEVVTESGTETRIVKTGMSDNSNTEIIEGLAEGDRVVIKASTPTAGTTGSGGSQQRAPVIVPGMGGIIR